MAKTVACRDIGTDCNFTAQAETEEYLLQKCAEHAREAHGMTEIPPEVAEKLRSVTRDIP